MGMTGTRPILDQISTRANLSCLTAITTKPDDEHSQRPTYLTSAV